MKRILAGALWFLAAAMAPWLVRAEQFSIVHIGDVHLGTASARGVDHMAAWLTNNQASMNIKLMSQTGDIVNSGTDDTAFNVAQNSFLAPLLGLAGNMAIGMSMGNHDYASFVLTEPQSHTASTKWRARFGEATWIAYQSSWYAGKSADDESHVQTFKAGGYTFLNIGLEWFHTGTSDTWLKGILDANPDKPTIISTHSYLVPWVGDLRLVKPEGASVWSIIRNYPQVFLVLSGHVYDTTVDGSVATRTVANTSGSQLMETVTDFQNCQPEKGWVRLFSIDTSSTSGNVKVTTIRTDTGAADTTDDFTWTLNFTNRFGPPSGGDDAIEPDAPTGLTATAISQDAIALSWSAATDNVGVTGYDVYRDGSNVAAVTRTSCTNTGLTPETIYTYTVKARDAAGNVSAASAPAFATTLAATPVWAEESFDYAATNLVGLNGGNGWSGSWTVESHYDTEAGCYAVAAGPLANYPGLTSAGGHGSFLSGGNGTFFAWAQRNLAAPITDDGGTYWLAFQLQAPGYHKNSSYTLAGATNAAFVQVKDDFTGMSFQFLGGAYYSPGDTNAHLFLIKIQMSGDANAETAWLYYDPDLGAAPSAWAALRTNTFVITSTNGLTGFRTDSARAGNTGYRTRIDELRIATTWQAAVGQGGGDANGNGLPDAWETTHFGSTTNAQGAADYDWDHDGLSNRQEYWAGTDPTNDASVLAITAMNLDGATNLVLQWQSAPGRTYKIQTSPALPAGFGSSIASNIVAAGGSLSRTVTVGAAAAGFYRVVVDP